jgi:cytoskeletal protein RodZ
MAEGEFWKGHELTTPISDELRAELTARSKDTLIQRLDKEAANKAHRESLLSQESDDDDTGDGVESEEDTDEGEEETEEVPYDKWTNAELIAEIDDRNESRVEAGLEPLPNKGKKPELVATLEADDAEDDDESEENE